MANPKALYQEVILDHNKEVILDHNKEVILDHNRKPRNYGTLGVFAVNSDAKCLGV